MVSLDKNQAIILRAALLSMAKGLKIIRDGILSTVKLIEVTYNIEPKKGNEDDRYTDAQNNFIEMSKHFEEGG